MLFSGLGDCSRNRELAWVCIEEKGKTKDTGARILEKGH